MQRGLANELVLIDADAARAEGEAAHAQCGLRDHPAQAGDHYAIGLGLLTLVEAILRDQNTVLTVSSPMRGQYGADGVAISMPSIVGRAGVEEVLNLTISDEELAAFQSSAQTLKERLAQL